MTIVEALRATADVLHARGWYQGAAVDPTDLEGGRVCLVGALQLAAANRVWGPMGTDYNLPVWHVARDQLVETIGGELSVGQWNDDDCVTEEDVHLLIKETIARLDGAA